MSDLQRTAADLVAPRKGILAADESTGTIGKRFDSIGLASTEEHRRRYRQMLLTTEGLGAHISGVILFDETIRQATEHAAPFVDLLTDAGIIPGIKVDTGAKPLAMFPGESVTEGLDGLRERLAEYAGLGARFAKWRATIFVGDGLPTETAIDVNAHAMARYAALCQEAGLVPIVEPEILMDGGHDLAACADATGRTLDALFVALSTQRVELSGSLLKVNMVVPGRGCPTQDDDITIAKATIDTLMAHVPAQLPGVVFLSGGMTDEQATNRLNEMNRVGDVPWELSFSYGRALQSASLEAWGGEESNVAAGQAALSHRARMNGLARTGSYSAGSEDPAA